MLKERYEIQKLLGESAEIKTYLAVDHILDQKVVVKEYSSVVWTADMQEKVRTLFGSFEVAGFAAEKDYFTEDDKGYVVSEYLPGGDLRHYMLLHSKTSAEEAFRMLFPAMEALQYLHSKGIVYGSLSPEHLCFDAEQRLCLTGIGVENQGACKAPEQAEDQDVGPWTDIYALCAVWYQMATGKKPDKSHLKNPSEYVMISNDWEQTMLQGLSSDIQGRYFSIKNIVDQAKKSSEAIDRLDGAVRHYWEDKWFAITTEVSGIKVQTSKKIRRRLWRRIIAGVLVCLILSFCVGCYLHTHRDIIYLWKAAQAQKMINREYEGMGRRDLYLRPADEDYDRLKDFLDSHKEVFESREYGSYDYDGYTRYSLEDSDYEELEGISGTCGRFALDKDTIYDAIIYYLEMDETKVEKAGDSIGAEGWIEEYPVNSGLLKLSLSAKESFYNYAGQNEFTISYDYTDHRVENVSFKGTYEEALVFLEEIEPLLAIENPLSQEETRDILDQLNEDYKNIKLSNISTLCIRKADPNDDYEYEIELLAENGESIYNGEYAGNYEKGSAEYQEFIDYVTKHAVSEEVTDSATEYELETEDVKNQGKPCNDIRMEQTKDEVMQAIAACGYEMEALEVDDMCTVTMRQYGNIETSYRYRELYALEDHMRLRIDTDIVNGDLLGIYMWTEQGDFPDAEMTGEISAAIAGNDVWKDPSQIEALKTEMGNIEKTGSSTMWGDGITLLIMMDAGEKGYTCAFSSADKFY